MGYAQAIPAHIYCFLSVTQWLPLIGVKERHHTCKSCSRGRAYAISAIPHIFESLIVVLGGMKYRPVTSRQDMTPQIILFCGGWGGGGGSLWLQHISANSLSFITKCITFVGKNDIMLGRASHNIMFANSCNKFSNK